MNTALFLSLFTLFGNPLGPTTTVRRAAIVQPVTQVRATVPTTTRVGTSATPAQVTPIRRAPRVPVTRRRIRIPAEQPREPEGTGSFRCTVTENGSTGSASYRVLKGSSTVATGRCQAPVASLPAGDYRVIVALDGMADGANRNMPLTIRDGRTSSIRAVFETARLTVTVMHDGRRIPGRAVLKKDGQTAASLGSGVYSRVSAGRYQVEITANYGSVRGSRTVTLDLAPGQVRALNVPF